MTLNKKEISIIIPAFNEEKVILKTLESIAAQKISVGFEVIIVNNNSTDKTVEIVQKFQQNHPNFLLITEKRQGIGHARKTGFSAAKGELLISTDADAIHSPSWLEKIYLEFNKNPRIVGYVGTYYFYDKSKIINYMFWLNLVITDSISRLIVGHYCFRGSNFAVTAEAYKNSGGFNSNINFLEDVELSLRVGKIGKIIYRPNIVIKTTARRFRGNFFKLTLRRLQVYYSIVILKTAPKNNLDVTR